MGIDIIEQDEAEDYLLLLKSFESVMQHVADGPDYLHPYLVPQPTIEQRTFWKPSFAENPLNAWSHRCKIESSAPTSSLLKGKTIVIKDNISVGGLPTTLGTFGEILSKSRVHPISPIDATVVARLLASGAIIVGTSTCENFCASPLSFSSATGPVHHPLLHGYTAGGSSSGSAALVAATAAQTSQGSLYGGAVDMAIGSDQAGSIRNPASYCGIYGLKPTFGLIPYTGAVSMSSMIDHLGPIASSMEDIALLLQVMAGWDGLDARMTPETPLVSQVKDYPALLANYRARIRQTKSSIPTIKIGLLKESFDIDGLAPEVRDGVYSTAKSYFGAAGAEVVEISIPLHLEGPIIWTAATRPSVSNWLCRGSPSGHLSFLPPHVRPQWPPSQKMYDLLTATNPALVNTMFSAQLVRDQSGWLEAKAHRRVFELRAAYDRALKEVDVLITPTTPSAARPHPMLRDDRGQRTGVMEKIRALAGVTNNTCPFNVTGHPALSIPAGVAPADGNNDIKLPYGMQIVGSRWCDEITLMAAALFEHGRSVINGC